MAIVIYNDNGTIKVVKLGTHVVSTDANATESYTITWKAYDGTTLKTETKDYGSTSAAPIGTTDTVQYDYSWPQNSVVVTGPQTIQETRTIKSYTITWKAYDGTIIDSETLWYGETAYAPTGTPEDSDWYYYWPQNSVVVTGPQTIQETRTIKSYTITWYFYNGVVARQDNLTYGSTSTAPTGTTDTAQYQYDWPKSSTTVTGEETISETRALKYYTVTWKDWDGTTLTAQSVAYGGNGTPPTQPTRTDYTFNGWSGTYTNVTSNRTITATYTINKYTVTFVRAWDGTTIKNQSVEHGKNADFPTDSQIDYGAGYEYSYYTGTYTNVTSNRTITIYRKTTPSQQGTWQYNGTSSQPFCEAPVYNMIGTSCSIIGETKVVAAGSVGMSGNCVELICKI